MQVKNKNSPQYCSGYMLHHKETPAHEIHYNSQKLLYCFTQITLIHSFWKKEKLLLPRKVTEEKLKRGLYKHRTQRPNNLGPKDLESFEVCWRQKCNYMKVVSMEAWNYDCVIIQSTRLLYTKKTLFTPDRHLCYFKISASGFFHSFLTLKIRYTRLLSWLTMQLYMHE